MIKRASSATVAMTKTNKNGLLIRLAMEAPNVLPSQVSIPTVVRALARLMAPPIKAMMLQLMRLL